MLIRYQDLTALRIEAADGAEHKLTDVLIDDRDLSLAYVVAKLEGWFRDRHAVVRREDFGAPDPDRGSWPANLRERDLKEAPAPAERGNLDQAPRPDENAAMPLGPYGAVIGPGVEPHHAAVPERDDPARLAGSGHPRSVGDWLGTPVGASDRPAGHLADLIFDTEDWKAKFLVLEIDAEMPAQRAVPVGAVRSLDWEAPGILLGVELARVEASPEMREVSRMGAEWSSHVARHYGL
jgi:hypothetical protein